MKTFKIGDTVRRIHGQHDGMMIGDSSVVLSVGQNFIKLDGFSLRHDCGNFELVKEAPTFNLKTSPWFIRVNNKEEFHIINEWLVVNFGCGLTGDYYSKMLYFTNAYTSGSVSLNVMWDARISNEAKEIKLNFKTSIYSVEYPEVKTQQEVAIEELEATIELAKQQILKLKEGK
jgi:hypothetical protein